MFLIKEVAETDLEDVLPYHPSAKAYTSVIVFMWASCQIRSEAGDDEKCMARSQALSVPYVQLGIELAQPRTERARFSVQPKNIEK